VTQNNHLLARFDYLCPDFIRLNLQTGRNLYAARESMFPLCEDTVTEMNLLEIASRHQDRVIVKRFNRKEESEGGADWSWWFLDEEKKEAIGFRIQAKIINWRFNEFRFLHYQSQSSSTSGSQGGVKSQTQMLIENAQKFNETPLYCLFADVWDAAAWKHAVQTSCACGCSPITPYRIWAAATRRWAAICRRSAIAWQRSAGTQSQAARQWEAAARQWEATAQQWEAAARQWEAAAGLLSTGMMVAVQLWEDAARLWEEAARQRGAAAWWWEEAAWQRGAAARLWEEAARQVARQAWEDAARQWEVAVQCDEDEWRAFVDAISLSSCCCCSCGTLHSCDFTQRIIGGSSGSNLSCWGSFIDAGCWLLRADAVQKKPGKKSLADFAADIFPWHCLVCCREKYPGLIRKRANLPPYVQQALNERPSFFSLDGESPPEVSKPPEGWPSILVIFFSSSVTNRIADIGNEGWTIYLLEVNNNERRE
jgi:hypothetical protein